MHVRSFLHMVEVGLTFRADDGFLRKKDFLKIAVSSVCNGGKPGKQVCMMPGLSGESRGRQIFGHGVADATIVGRRICCTFFRSHRQEHLAHAVKMWRAAS